MKQLKNFNLNPSMDDLSNDKRNERLTGFQSIYTQATGVLVFVLVIYSFLLKYDIVGPTGYFRKTVFKDLFSIEIFSDTFDLIVENVILTVLFIQLLLVIRFLNQKLWIKNNKNIWVNGFWLHIHEKNDSTIRVGYVKLTQSFDSINAEAENYDAFDILNPDKRTSWGYYNAQIDNQQLRGFYHSVKANQKKNSGMHCLDIVKRRYDYPTEMRGYFGDNYILDSDKISDIQEHKQHCGRLTLIRMTKEQEEFLVENGCVSSDKLHEMFNNPKFAKDEYVKRYHRFVSRTNWWLLYSVNGMKVISRAV